MLVLVFVFILMSYLFYVYGHFVCMYCVYMCVLGILKGQKQVLDPLAVLMVGNHHLDAGNSIWVFCK